MTSSHARSIVLGTRGSRLALARTEQVADALRALDHSVEVRRIRGAAPRDALLSGRADAVVHALAELPPDAVAGLTLAAVLPRGDWHDVLCARDRLALSRLPAGARVGVRSAVAAAELRALRPDLRVLRVRGTIAGGLARVLGPRPDLDAVVVAAADLALTGRPDAATDVLDDLLPAPAQGALAVECRANDEALVDALAELDDPDARFATAAERAVLAGLGAGRTPVGALCFRRGNRIGLAVKVLSPDGARVVGRSVEARPTDDPQELGRRTAGSLLAAGAAELVALKPLVSGEPAATNGVPIVFPRLPHDAHWVVFTTPEAVRVLREQGYDLAALGRSGIAAVGATTRLALTDAGVRVAFPPERSATPERLAEVFPSGSGRVLVPASPLDEPELLKALRAKGWTVVAIPTFTASP